ncbi:MAG: hypothetical protein ACOCP8_03300 [archaeon]
MYKYILKKESDIIIKRLDSDNFIVIKGVFEIKDNKFCPEYQISYNLVKDIYFQRTNFTYKLLILDSNDNIYEKNFSINRDYQYYFKKYKKRGCVNSGYC